MRSLLLVLFQATIRVILAEVNLEDVLGQCPYCDPNYIDIPNLQSALKGYNLPMGDPDSKLSFYKIYLRTEMEMLMPNRAFGKSTMIMYKI